jgi:hypothetical protein
MPNGKIMQELNQMILIDEYLGKTAGYKKVNWILKLIL